MIASEPTIFAFSRLKFVGKSHICRGNSVTPPPPPIWLYASGAHAKFACEARGENGKWMHKLVVKR